MAEGVKVGDGFILVKPVLDKTELAKTQAEAKAAFQRNVNDQLGFQKTANNQFLEASRKLNSQRDSEQAASGKRQLDQLKNSISAQTSLEAQKQKVFADLDKERSRAATRATQDRVRAQQILEKDAQRESVKATREAEKLKTAIQRAEDKERNGSSQKSLAAHIRNIQTLTPNFALPVFAGATALPAALGTLSNLLPVVTAGLAILPTLFTSAAVSVGILGIALHGLSGAWSALDNAQASAGSDAVANAAALSAAQKTVRKDTEALARAQRDSIQAVKDAKAAQDDLNQAYIEAANNLADLDLRQKRNSLDLLDLQDAQVQAQQGLINAQSTGDPRKIAQAQRALDEANQSLEEQRQQIKENTQENDKAVAKGVAGSDRVTQAQQKVLDSNQAVIDSQQKVRDTTEDLATAQKALAAQLAGATGSAKTLNNALSLLAPNARKVVVGLHAALGAQSEFAQGIQNAFFAPFVSSNVVAKISGLVKSLEGPLDAAAESLGATFSGIFGALTDPKGSAGLKGTLNGIKDFFTEVNPGVKAFSDGFLALSGKGGAFGGAAGKVLSDLLTKFGDFLGKVDIKGLFEAAKPVVASVLKTVENLSDTLGSLFKIAGKTNFLSIFEQLSQTISDFAKSKDGQAALTALFKALNSIGGGAAKILGEALRIVGDALIQASPFIGPFVDALVQLLATLQPLGGPLGKLLGLVLSELTVAFTDLTPIIQPLIAALATLLDTYLNDAISLFGQLVAELPQLKPLFDAITKSINTLLPIGLQLVDRFFGALGQNLPTLTASFGRLLDAVVPLIPPVTQLLASILSNPVTFQAFSVGILAIAEAFNQLATAINAVVSVYNGFARIFNLPTIQTGNTIIKALPKKPVESFGKKGFADGGYTGDGGRFQPAGIVHAGEFVAPQSMSALFPALESIRKGLPGYADGGIVGTAESAVGALTGGLGSLLRAAMPGSIQGLPNGALGAVSGQLISGLLGLAPPLLRDSGGTVPPGLSLVANHTGRHETIRTADQEAALGGGDTYVTVMIDGQEFQGRIDTTIEKRERKLGKQFQGK